ncbi:hypothetical protein PYS58_19580 [Chryseobacterium indologenes]|uniref:hypothetical protein n=1 Tax=Chryseobacterium TaxID=59732 RepID=UPI001625C548|nr:MULTISPECIES: hypothetical protein [Chryseobacterium]MDM1556392.1 hypothetical protein [Chryseobacterium indologenes]WET48747.1 hypothetical protein PYS58_19580 [Chryseobacterium indologenes]
MKKSIPFLLLLFFTAGFMKSQDKSSDPFLLQTWKLNKLDDYIYTYEKQSIFDAKTPGLKFSKNGKIIGNLSKSANGYDAKEDFPGKASKMERYMGSWKKVSDTTIAILFSSNNSMNGTFVISRLTESGLKLRKVFSKDVEKKLDSIRRIKNISY